MILSELQGRLQGQSKEIFELLWDIVSGRVPQLDFLTDKEASLIFKGEDIDDVKSPFLLLGKSMRVRKLPLMTLQTSKSRRSRQRQMSVCRMLDTVNKMLEILELEAESLAIQDVIF